MLRTWCFVRGELYAKKYGLNVGDARSYDDGGRIAMGEMDYLRRGLRTFPRIGNSKPF